MNKHLKNLIWLLVLIVLSIVTLEVVVNSSGDFSFADFRNLVSGMNPIWIALALVFSFGFIFFEALGLRYTCRFFNHPAKMRQTLLYSATDFYFSGITPTAAGGQPAALVVMANNNVPTAISAMALMLNLVMYTASLLIIGIFFFIINPSIFFSLDTFSKICIIVGTLVQVVLVWCYVLCMFKDRAVLSVCDWCLKLLCKIRILKNYEQKKEKLVHTVEQYRFCGEQLRHEKKLPLRVLICNIGQRMSVILVPVCIFLGLGGSYSQIPDALSAQTLAILGSNAMPIPGAVGISDFLFLQGFGTLTSDPVSLDLLSRGISFFLPLIISGIVVFMEIIKTNVRDKDSSSPRFLNFVFNKKAGKPIKRILTNPVISHIAGSFMDTRVSRCLIKKFIRNNNIEINDYVQEEYTCFNDFFTRRIKPELRPVDYEENDFISPCDGMLSAYRLSPDCRFSVKQIMYTAEELVRDAELAKRYENGLCLVLRLGVDNYHRYCYLDDGTKSENHFIKGRYNPVMPLVSLNNPVYRQNSREYCILHTKSFGDIVQIEVGACMVGRIINHHETYSMHRGEEKGMFQYGGSTIVLLIEDGVLDIDEEIFELTKDCIETPIKYGAKIGTKHISE